MQIRERSEKIVMDVIRRLSDMGTIAAENKDIDRNRQKNTKRRTGKVLGWILLAAAMLVIVPVGCIMFMISGIWSAADRVLNKLGK